MEVLSPGCTTPTKFKDNVFTTSELYYWCQSMAQKAVGYTKYRIWEFSSDKPFSRWYLHSNVWTCKYSSCDKAMQPKVSEEQVAWHQFAEELEQSLSNGRGHELSVIGDSLNNIYDNCTFRNRDGKVFQSTSLVVGFISQITQLWTNH